VADEPTDNGLTVTVSVQRKQTDGKQDIDYQSGELSVDAHVCRYVGTPYGLTEIYAAAAAAAAAAIDRYLLPAPDLSNKPASRRRCCRSTGQTDGRTDRHSAVFRRSP